MAEFTPTVHRDFVRNALPGMPGRKVANVANDEIDDYIANATREVLRVAGEPEDQAGKAELEYIIKLYAQADTLERSLVEQGVSDVPIATGWRTRADTKLQSYDRDTSGEGESERAAVAANVRNLAPDKIGIFSPDDFGVNGSGHVPGTADRDILF